MLNEADTRAYLVLDKDFFQGCRRDDLESIACSGVRFIVIAETYMELCTTDDLREQLLRKLHGLSPHIDILDHIGTLYKYEIDNRLPCSPVIEHFIRGALNPNFTFQFTDEQSRVIQGEKDHLENRAPNEFLGIVKEIAIKNPGFDEGDICCAEIIRQVYGRLRKQESRLPPPNLLDDRWAIYRKVQVDLLAAFDYLRSYDGKEFRRSVRDRAHDQIDFRVCIVGALVGGLATRDNMVTKYFQTICPMGRLVQRTY